MTVKQSNVHFITKFGLNISENDKIMLFQPRQLAFLSVRAACRLNCLIANGFTEKTEWPSSCPDLKPLDYHIRGAILEKYHELQPKHKTTDKLKVAVQTIWEEPPQEHVDRAVANFTKCLTAYMAVAANGGHSKHLQ